MDIASDLPAPSGPGIAVQDLTVRYRNGHTALEGASFELGMGSICALVGVNGSGKSTLFKALMGFVRPTRGSVLLGGMPVAEALKRNMVAYVPQSEDVDWNFPVLVQDVVMMGRYGHMNFLRMATREDRRKVDEALERVGMTAYRTRQIGELSGGQKKRVFLARSLAQEGRIILLDEPFTGVDPIAVGDIQALVRHLTSLGIGVLITDHNVRETLGLIDRAYIIHSGNVLFEGQPDEVVQSADVRRLYLGEQFTL